jgi:hypothetical protein
MLVGLSPERSAPRTYVPDVTGNALLISSVRTQCSVHPCVSASGYSDLHTGRVTMARSDSLAGYKPRLSFTATAMSCSDPRLRSVVWMEEWPSRNLICSRSPPFLSAADNVSYSSAYILIWCCCGVNRAIEGNLKLVICFFARPAGDRAEIIVQLHANENASLRVCRSIACVDLDQRTTGDIELDSPFIRMIIANDGGVVANRH